MNDDELTRLAIKLLEKEGQRFVRERALTKPGPLKANKAFLRAQLKHNEISNRRINSKTESPTITVDETVNTPKRKSSQNETANNTNYHMLSTKRHIFNRHCLKNKTHVNKLTKDLKVSFKFQIKAKSLKSNSEVNKDTMNLQNNRIAEECNDDVDAAVKPCNGTGDVGPADIIEDVINISDNDSVISVSSAEHSDSSKKKKSYKRTQKRIKKQKSS